MHRLLVAAVCLTAALTANAQQSRRDMAADPSLTASNYLAYPGPQRQLTPAPRGYEAFYLSHYGRHGSRYLINDYQYDRPWRTLLRADSAGQLTPLGRDALRRVTLIRNEAAGRHGELTLRGAEQHREIVRRMVERFPSVFAGEVRVDARSTTVIRCILSMENALQELSRLRPQLDIRHDASAHDMWYMNQHDPHLDSLKRDSAAQAVYKAFSRHHENYRALMGRLFTTADYWEHQVNARQLADDLYRLASNVQSTELRREVSLYDLFTTDELYDMWLRTNAWWYIAYGPSPLNGGTQPFSQRNLLRRIIAEADSCIKLPHPGATLRYGHDTMVMPLTCLMELNGYGQQTRDLEQLDDMGWLDYRIFPMACNIQLVFYRPVGGAKGDILVKILQNEDEARLPFGCKQWPYYRWADVRDYCLSKIASYKE